MYSRNVYEEPPRDQYHTDMDVDRYDRLSRDRFDDNPDWDPVRSQNHQWDDAPVSRSPGTKNLIFKQI